VCSKHGSGEWSSVLILRLRPALFEVSSAFVPGWHVERRVFVQRIALGRVRLELPPVRVADRGFPCLNKHTTHYLQPTLVVFRAHNQRTRAHTHSHTIYSVCTPPKRALHTHARTCAHTQQHNTWNFLFSRPMSVGRWCEYLPGPSSWSVDTGRTTSNILYLSFSMDLLLSFSQGLRCVHLCIAVAMRFSPLITEVLMELWSIKELYITSAWVVRVNVCVCGRTPRVLMFYVLAIHR